MVDNRMFDIGTGIVNEFFPGSYRWMELYVIAREGEKDTERELTEVVRSIIKDGYIKDHEKIAAMYEDALTKEAASLFEKYKEHFPKTLLKRKPNHIHEFCKKCVNWGVEEFRLNMLRAIEFSEYKMAHT